MKNIDAIIFDLDGTLVDSLESITISTNLLFKELGLPEKTPEQLRDFVGGGIEFFLKRVMPEEFHPQISEAALRYHYYYKKEALPKAKMYNGVVEVLNHFKDKPMAIVTNRIHASAVNILEVLGIKNYFKVIVGGDDPELLKPAPTAILNFIDQYAGGSKNSLMIGDMDVDVQAGKNASVISVGVAYGIGKEEDVKKESPDYLLKDISELKELFR